VWLRKLEVTDNDLIEKLMYRIIVKRSSASEHKVQDDSARPDVSQLPIIASVLHDLWSNVVQSAARSVHQIRALLQLPAEHGKSKVTDFDSACFIDKNVLRFQVSMRDPPLVTVVHST
jgi:hypothetical protein